MDRGKKGGGRGWDHLHWRVLLFFIYYTTFTFDLLDEGLVLLPVLVVLGLLLEEAEQLLPVEGAGRVLLRLVPAPLGRGQQGILGRKTSKRCKDVLVLHNNETNTGIGSVVLTHGRSPRHYYRKIKLILVLAVSY